MKEQGNLFEPSGIVRGVMTIKKGVCARAMYEGSPRRGIGLSGRGGVCVCWRGRDQGGQGFRAFALASQVSEWHFGDHLRRGTDSPN